MSESEHSDQGGIPQFLRDPKGVFKRRWRWIVGILALGFGGTTAFVVAFVAPLYAAQATILVTDQAIPDDFIRSTVEEDSLSRLDAIVGAVLSREELSKMIAEYELYANYRDVFPMGELVAIMRERIRIRVEAGVAPSGGASSRVVGVRFRDERAEPAAAVANDLASRLIAESIAIRTQQARVTTEFLRTQLTDIEQQLKAHERQITEFHMNYRGTLPSELESNLRKLERLQQQRQSLALQISAAETRLDVLYVDPGAAHAPDSPQGRLSALRLRLAEQLAIHTEDHPNVQSIQRQIEDLEGAGGEQGRNEVLVAATRSLADLRTQLDETNEQIGDIDLRVAETPVRSEELSDLEERAEVLRVSYLEFLRKVQDAELAESLEAAQQGERISVLDRAVPPQFAAQTRVKYLALGYLVSLAAALGVAVLFEMVDPVLISAEQVEADFGLPVLGSVPHII